jgi:hypothetical protein
MNKHVRFFGLISSFLLLISAPLNLAAQNDENLQTLAVGDTVDGIRSQAEFLLDGQAGETITLRWDGDVPHSRDWFCAEALFDFILDAKTELTNADGDVMEQLDRLYLDDATLERYLLEGPGPYRLSAALCGATGITLTVQDESALSEREEPALNIGETRSLPNTAAQQNLVTVIPLNVQQGDEFTVRTRYMNSRFGDDDPDLFALVRDGHGRVVPNDMAARMPNWFAADFSVYTVSGTLPYRLELVAIYPASYEYRLSHYSQFMEAFTDDFSFEVALEPGNTVIDDAGVLEVGSRTDDTMLMFNRFYTLNVAEGEIITLTSEVSGAEIFNMTLWDGSRNSVEGPIDASFPDSVDGRSIGVEVYQMSGPAPYTLMIQGDGSYTIAVEAGNTVSGEPAEVESTGPTCTVNANSDIDVRSEAGLYESVVGTLASGETATADGFRNDRDTGETWWYRLTTGGWVPQAQLT